MWLPGCKYFELACRLVPEGKFFEFLDKFWIEFEKFLVLLVIWDWEIWLKEVFALWSFSFSLFNPKRLLMPVVRLKGEDCLFLCEEDTVFDKTWARASWWDFLVAPFFIFNPLELALEYIVLWLRLCTPCPIIYLENKDGEAFTFLAGLCVICVLFDTPCWEE